MMNKIVKQSNNKNLLRGNPAWGSREKGTGKSSNPNGRARKEMYHNAFRGVNGVCAQCIHDCKQYANVILVNCPHFQSNQTGTHKPSSFGNRSNLCSQGDKSGRRRILSGAHK